MLGEKFSKTPTKENFKMIGKGYNEKSVLNVNDALIPDPSIYKK